MKDCNHKFKVVEDYTANIGFLWRKERVKIFECKKCGMQYQRCFALEVGEEHGK